MSTEQRLQVAAPLLIDNFRQLSAEKNVLALLHRDRVKDVPHDEFTKIIYHDCFSGSERSFMKEARRKCVNRRAASVTRLRRKLEETELDSSLDQMKKERAGLLDEKLSLQRDIELYERLTEEMKHQEPLFDQIYQFALCSQNN